jgi:hypothetical protein
MSIIPAWTRKAIGLALVVAWCSSALNKAGSVPPANDGAWEIDSIVLSFTQGGDGKEAETGFRMDIDPGMGPGASADPMFTVYTCGTENQPFDGHSKAAVILKPAPSYRGKLDLAILQSSGGHIHIWPICYLPNSTSGIGYDVWDITNVAMTIWIRPAAGEPRSKIVGGPDGSLVWNLDGPNMLVLSSQSGNEADLYFDARLNAHGMGN